MIYNNDFVNIPNAFLIHFKFDDDKDFWSLDHLKIKDYQHRLYMKTGETGVKFCWNIKMADK